jgi:hypothetical protein
VQPWLRLMVAMPGGVTDLRWQDAPVEPTADGRYRVNPALSEPSAGPGFVKLYSSWPSPWIFDHWGWHAL